MSFSIFKIKTVTGANVAGFILGTALFSMFLMLTLYMQQVLGYSALKSGFAYLAVAGTSIVWATLASQLVTRIGVKTVLVTGMSLLTVGMLYFTQVSVGGSYVRDLLPGFLIVAVGMSFAFVSVSIAALAGIEAKDAGLASGMINTSQQIGGALGIAILSSVAVAQTGSAARAGDSVPDGADDRLPRRVLGRHGHCRSRRGRLGRADPQGGARRRSGRRGRRAGRGAGARRLARIVRATAAGVGAWPPPRLAVSRSACASPADWRDARDGDRTARKALACTRRDAASASRTWTRPGGCGSMPLPASSRTPRSTTSRRRGGASPSTSG